MFDTFTDALIGVFIGVLIMLACLLASGNQPEVNYKKGQTDALSGIIKYEKITHKNQTVTWEKIKEKGDE